MESFLPITLVLLAALPAVPAAVVSGGTGEPGPAPRPWSELIHERGANFYAIQREFRRQREAEENGPLPPAALAKQARGAGAPGVRKEGGHIQYLRWERYVGPRVYPSGDLSLLARATWEGAEPWLGLSAPPPPMAGQWIPVGPMSVPVQALPQQHAGAGRLNFVRVLPGDPNTLWVGAPGGGLWATRNGGATWATAGDRLAVLGAADIVLDPADPGIQYLATGDADHDISTRSVGVLKSLDGGLTWAKTGLTFEVSEGMRLTRLLILPLTPPVLLAGGMTGIWRSVDGGARWTKVLDGQVIRDMEAKPGDPLTVYAGGGRFFRSVNAGAAFSLVAGVPEVHRMAIAVSAAAKEAVYLACANERTFHSFRHSADAGATFAVRSSTPNILGYSRTGDDDEGQAFYDLGLAVSPANPEEVLVGGINIWKSANGGRAWSVLTDNNEVHWDIHALEYANGSRLYAASDGGIYTSANAGADWTTISKGLSIAEVNRIGTSPHGDGRILAGLQDNGVHLFENGLWSHVVGGDGFECFFDRADPKSLFASIQGGYVSRSLDGGQDWDEIMGNGMVGPFNTSWQQDPKDANALWWGSTQVWKSANKGVSWTQLGAVPGSNPANNILVDPNNTQVVYSVKNELVAKSSNGGSSWAAISSALPKDAAFQAIAVAQGASDQVWLACSGYSAGNKVHKSLDGGKTWANYSQGLPNLPANTIIHQRGTQGGVYLGMDVGVYYRDASMAAWVPFFKDLPNVNIQELEIRYGATVDEGRLYAATYGRGLWESPLFNSSVVRLARDRVPAAWPAWEAKAGPGRHEVTLRLSGLWQGSLALAVADVRGKLVHRGTLRASRSAGALQADQVLRLPASAGPGLYQVLLTSPAGTAVRSVLLP